MKTVLIICYFLALLFVERVQAEEKEQQELIEKLKSNEVLYIQQVCMTYTEPQCKKFNYEQYLTRKNMTGQVEELNQMAKFVKHLNPQFSFQVINNQSIGIVPSKNTSKDTYLFRCNNSNTLTNEFNISTFYNSNEMKNDFETYKKLLKEFELERELSLALNLLLHMENISHSIFSLYLPHIPSSMNVPLFSFGLAEIQVLTSIDNKVFHKLMKKRMEVQSYWYRFQNVTSNYTASQMQRIFNFKEERLVDFADFAWALLHVYKYSIDYEGILYLIPGIEFVRQQNDHLKKLYYQTEVNSDFSLFASEYKKNKPVVQHYTLDPEYYFIFNREISHNHPKHCVELQIIEENEIGQCTEDILFYANIKKGKLCVRKDKEFLQQVDVFIQVINLKRSFSCKCRDDIRETVYKNHNINLIESLQIIREKCLFGKHNDPKNYSKDIRPQFQKVLDVQKSEYDGYLNKLSNKEYVLKNLEGIYFDNLDLLYQYAYYKRKSLTILERAIKKAYAASDQYKLFQQHGKPEQKLPETKTDIDNLFNEVDEKVEL